MADFKKIQGRKRFIVFDSLGNFMKAFSTREEALNYKYTFGHPGWKVWHKLVGVIG